MTYVFKLSRRLAVARVAPFAVLALAACDTVDPLDSGERIDAPMVALSPARATAEPYQTIKLAFRDQLNGVAEPSYDVEWTVIGGGGSIAPDGSFRATKPGVYEIYGAKGKGNGGGNNGNGKGNGGPRNQTDTAIVVVVEPPPALVAVEVTPANASVDAGGHLQFDVVGRNADGATVALGVEWTATGGSIDPGGLYIAGSAAGTYRVIAKHAGSGLADTAAIAVEPEAAPEPVPAPDTAAAPAPAPAPAPSPAPTGDGNRPADYIMLSDRGFGAKVENGWTDRGDNNFSIVSDRSAPRSSEQVGQARFPAGHPSGSGPIFTSFQLSGQRELYLSFWIKLSDNWYGNDAGVNKIFFIWTHGKPVVYLSAQGAGTGRLEPQVRLQDTPDGARNLTPNLASPSLERGRWYRWELVLEANTPGKADGAARWWIDGVPVGDYSGLRFSGADQSSVWESVVWNPTYGGGGAPVPADQWMWIDHAAIAGR